MSATKLVPEAWTKPGVNVPKRWIRDAEAIARDRADELLFVSERSYRQISSAYIDVNALGFAPLDAKIRPDADARDGLRYRIVIRAGRRPEAIERHLRRIAPGYPFFSAREVLDEPDEPDSAGA